MVDPLTRRANYCPERNPFPRISPPLSNHNGWRPPWTKHMSQPKPKGHSFNMSQPTRLPFSNKSNTNWEKGPPSLYWWRRRWRRPEKQATFRDFRKKTEAHLCPVCIQHRGRQSDRQSNQFAWVTFKSDRSTKEQNTKGRSARFGWIIYRKRLFVFIRDQYRNRDDDDGDGGRSW